MQKSRNYILLIELVLGGKGEGVDAAKLAVRPVSDELFDCAYRLRLFSQSIEKAVSFAGNFHGSRSVTQYRVARKNGKQKTDESKQTNVQCFLLSRRIDA